MDVLDCKLYANEADEIMKTAVGLKAVGDWRKEIIFLYVCSVFHTVYKDESLLMRDYPESSVIKGNTQRYTDSGLF